MEKQLNLVTEFHERFKQEFKVVPYVGTQTEALLRHKLMAEENDEYLEAVQNNDVVALADALGDQLYILCGTIIKHGMQNIIEKAFDKIHVSNMTKLDVDGSPILREDGKILKGPNFEPVNLKPLFKDYEL